MVTVSPAVKSTVGSRAKVVGPPVGVTFWIPLLLPSTLIVPLTLTASSKVTVILVLAAMLVALSAGVVSVTVGATSPAHSVALLTPGVPLGVAKFRNVAEKEPVRSGQRNIPDGWLLPSGPVMGAP